MKRYEVRVEERHRMGVGGKFGIWHTEERRRINYGDTPEKTEEEVLALASYLVSKCRANVATEQEKRVTVSIVMEGVIFSETVTK